MNVSVVTVTYGDRIDYMRKMIDSIESQSVGVSVVVVDNASVNGVELEKLVGGSAFSSTVLRNEENLGSAMGYKIGIEYAYNHGADYIYLLDDDNCLDKHAIDFLVEAYLRLDDDTIIYSSLRYNRKKYRDLVSGNVDNVVRKSNKFIGFGIDFFCNNGSDDKGGIEYLTYGGLMLPSSVVKVVGYPDVDYFLYQDDRDYTYRMTLSGFHLKILDSSIVFDSRLIKENDIFIGLKSNNRDGNSFALDAIKKGVILFGQENFVKFMKNG